MTVSRLQAGQAAALGAGELSFAEIAAACRVRLCVQCNMWVVKKLLINGARLELLTVACCCCLEARMLELVWSVMLAVRMRSTNTLRRKVHRLKHCPPFAATQTLVLLSGSQTSMTGHCTWTHVRITWLCSAIVQTRYQDISTGLSCPLERQKRLLQTNTSEEGQQLRNVNKRLGKESN